MTGARAGRGGAPSAELGSGQQPPGARHAGLRDEEAIAKEFDAEARAVPAMARLREVVAFVGKGRPATKAGNLKAADAVALASRLGTGERVPAEVRSMDDRPEAAHAFRWAAASGFLEWRGNRIVAAPFGDALERDPITTWLRATVTLLEHGVLDGFRQGWRKSYVELLDANVPGLLVAIVKAGGKVPIATIADGAWDQVSAVYGYEPDDRDEQGHVTMLVHALVSQLADIGILVRHGDRVNLTELGSLVAMVIDLSSDLEEDDDDLDLVDTDAQSLLLVCVEEGMEPAEARPHLLAWCQERTPREAAAELCEAMLDDDDPDVWRLGFEALGMVDRAVAERAVRRLRSHPGLRPLATAWLRGEGRYGPFSEE